MRLNDKLVTSFIYKGVEYDIDLAFDNVLDVFDVLSDKTLREYEMASICLALLLGKQEHPHSITLWNFVFEKYIKFEDKKPIQYDRKGNPMPVLEDEEDEEPLMDLDQDADYIFASFKQAYQMDLFQEQGRLHWHQFKALLQGLPSETIMQRVIQIRSWKPSKHDSTENKETMKKLQQVYALREVD